VVVGVTNESKSLVEKTIKKNRMEFPVAMVKTPEEASYGIRGFPSSFLLDVDGTILWKGHPAAFEKEYSKSRLESALKRTSMLPPVPEDHESLLGKYVAADNFAGAYKAATRELRKHPEDESLQKFVSSIEDMAEARAQSARAAEQNDEYGKAREMYSALAKQFAGVPVAEEAEAAGAEIGKNKEAKDDLAAAKKWKTAMASWRKGDFDKALKSVKSIARKYGDTATGQRADEMLSRHDS